jgi:hypothetical protein
MSLSEFMSDIEWSRAPSPFLPFTSHHLYGGHQNYDNDNGEYMMRIPELSLGDPYHSEDGDVVFPGRGADGPAHPELRLLIIDKSKESTPLDSNSERSPERLIVDAFRENREDDDWEEWEDDLDSLHGDDINSRTDPDSALSHRDENISDDTKRKIKVQILWNRRKSTLLYVLPSSRDWTAPTENTKLRKILTSPFTRLKPLLSSSGLDEPSAELRRMLSVPKLGLWTAVVLGMDSREYPPNDLHYKKRGLIIYLLQPLVNLNKHS